MSGTFTNDRMECICGKVPEDAAMLLLGPHNVLLDVHHRDCPDHGWIRHPQKEETSETEKTD